MNSQHVSNEALARMVKEGFDQTGKDLEQIQGDVHILKNDVFDIKLRLDHVAYRFELKELEQRVEVLEQR